MKRPELRSDRLRVFDALVRAGGFSAAARALDTTQSTVSQTIAALEADVGEALIDRSARGLRLTEAGRTLHRHARAVLEALEATRDALARLDEVVTGQVSVGTSDTWATHLLPPVFAAFRRAYPGVELRLDNRPSPAIAEKVAARELDLGVVSLPLPRGSSAVEALTQVPLRAQRDVVICRPGHPLAARPRLKPAELARHPLVLLDRTTASRAWLERLFAAHHVAPRVAMEMSSLEVLKRLVELDFGVSVVPELAVEEEVRQGRLVARPLHGVERRMVGLLLPASPGRAAAAFAELARKTFAP
ncbi:MAG: LysR family transcriptional regulator [Myxococcota bacterium]